MESEVITSTPSLIWAWPMKRRKLSGVSDSKSWLWLVDSVLLELFRLDDGENLGLNFHGLMNQLAHASVLCCCESSVHSFVESQDSSMLSRVKLEGGRA